MYQVREIKKGLSAGFVINEYVVIGEVIEGYGDKVRTCATYDLAQAIADKLNSKLETITKE